MCGIAGRVGPSWSPADAAFRLPLAQRWLRHRGPDAQGLWRGPAGTGEVALLHARLAIIDLTPGGAQPFASDDGRLQLTFNGEIYNYLDLRRELIGLGARFRSESDTEVILRAWEQWGEACVARLRGMFAFALWDGRQQVLFAARDRLGIKPFFYAQHEGALAFASELRPLFALEPVPRELDPAALDDYLTYLYVPPPGTIYKHVRELAPAHMLAARFGPKGLAVETRRYWTPPTSRLAVGGEEAARLVRRELETVVRQHMLSDVPLGAFLSGGLDSTTLVGLMAQQSSRPVRTFCMTFGDGEQLYDEREYAEAVARRYHTDHTLVPVRPDVSALLPTLVRHFGQPFGNPTALLVAELSAQTRKHVTVALAGDGGDELFFGYPRYFGLRMKARYQHLPERLRGLVARAADRFLVDSLRGRHAWRRAREFLAAGTDSVDEAYASWVTYFNPAERGRLLAADLQRSLQGHRAESWLSGLLAATGRRDPAERAAQADLSSFLPGNVLAYGDRMSMLHALETRVPFCDHVLVELLLSLPSQVKLRGGTYKSLLLHACGDLLPTVVQKRKKLGFNPPMAFWLNGALRGLVDEVLGGSDAVMNQFFRPEAIRALVGEHRAARRDRSLHLWALLVFRAWFQADSEDAAELDREQTRASASESVLP
jgi:asparagine synthase (glutamine-hydrolysing)